VRQQRSRDSGGARGSDFSSAATGDGAVAVSVDARTGDRSASVTSDGSAPTREWRASGSAEGRGPGGVAPRVKRASASAAAAVAAAGRAIRGSVGWGRSSGSARRLQLAGGSAGAERSAVEMSTLNPVATALRGSAPGSAAAARGDSAGGLGIDPRGMRVFLLQQQQEAEAAAAASRAAQGDGAGADGAGDGGGDVSLLAVDLPAGDAGSMSPSPAVLMAAAGGGRSSIRLLRRLSHQAAARLSLPDTLQAPLSASASSRMLLRARASGNERAAFAGSSARNLFSVPASSAAAATLSLEDAEAAKLEALLSQQALTASNRSLTHSASLQSQCAAASLRRIGAGATAPNSRRASGDPSRRSRRREKGAAAAAEGAGDRSDSSQGGSGAEGTDGRSDAGPDALSGGGCEEEDAASGAVGLFEHSGGGGAGGVNPLALHASPRDGTPDGVPNPGGSGGAAPRSARGTRRPTAAVPSGFSQVPLQVIREQRSRAGVRPSSGAAVANPLLAALYAGAAGSHSSLGSSGSRLSGAAPMGGSAGGSNSTLLSANSSSGGSDSRVVGSGGAGGGVPGSRGGVSSWRPPSDSVLAAGRQVAPAQAAPIFATGSLLGTLGRWLPFGGRGRVPQASDAGERDLQRHRRGVSAERAAGFPVMQVGGGRGTSRQGQPHSRGRAGSGGASGGGLFSRLTGALGWGSGGRGQDGGDYDEEDGGEGESDSPPYAHGYNPRSGSTGGSQPHRGHETTLAARSGQLSGGVHSLGGPGGRANGHASLALSPQQHQALLAAMATSRDRERAGSEAGHFHEGQHSPPSRPHRTTRSDGSSHHEHGAGTSGDSGGGGGGGRRRSARRSGEGGQGFGRDREPRHTVSRAHHGQSGGDHSKRRPAPPSGDAALDSRTYFHGGYSSYSTAVHRDGGRPAAAVAAQQEYLQHTAPMSPISEAGEHEDGRSRAASGSSVALSQTDTRSGGASDGSGSPASASPGSPALSTSSDASGSPATRAVSAAPSQQLPGHRRSLSSGSARSGRAGHRPLSAILELASELSSDHMRLAETDEAALGRAALGLCAAGAVSTGTSGARAWQAQQRSSSPAGSEATGLAADGDGDGTETAPSAQAARLSRSSVLRLPSAPASSGVAGQRRSVVLVAPPDWLLAAAGPTSAGAAAAGAGGGLSSGDVSTGSRRASAGAPSLKPGSILLPSGGRPGHRGSLVAGVSLRPDGTFGLNLGAGPGSTDIVSHGSAEEPASRTAVGGVASHSRAAVAPEADDGMSLGLLPLTLAADEDAAGADEHEDGAW
jgi:hypothetical protein